MNSHTHTDTATHTHGHRHTHTRVVHCLNFHVVTICSSYSGHTTTMTSFSLSCPKRTSSCSTLTSGPLSGPSTLSSFVWAPRSTWCRKTLLISLLPVDTSKGNDLFWSKVWWRCCTLLFFPSLFSAADYGTSTTLSILWCSCSPRVFSTSVLASPAKSGTAFSESAFDGWPSWHHCCSTPDSTRYCQTFLCVCMF